MATDHDGNTLQVGDNVLLPGTIATINTNGTITVTPSYGGGNVGLDPAKVRKPRSFPDAP